MNIENVNLITETTVEEFSRIVFNSCIGALFAFGLLFSIIYIAVLFVRTAIKCEKEQRECELEQIKQETLQSVFDYLRKKDNSLIFTKDEYEHYLKENKNHEK